jgi:hypothetical protein
VADDNPDTGKFMNLKEYISLTLRPIEQQLNQVNQTIDRITGASISTSQFDQLKLQVASLSELLQELEKRVGNLEKHDSVGVWFFRLTVTVGTALLIAWLGGFIR